MIIEKHFTWPGGGQYYSLGVNVLRWDICCY